MSFDFILRLEVRAKIKLVIHSIGNAYSIRVVILSKGDPVAQWKDIVKGYDVKGVQDAIKEVNDEAAKRGIK